MALFSRKQPVQTQIPELQDYYATQKQQSTATAWLLAIGSLLITVAIFFGLFLGGRWLYRAVTNKDDSKVAVETENKPDDSTTIATDQTNSNSATIGGGTVTVNGAPSSSVGSISITPASGVSPSQSKPVNQSAVVANTSLPNSGPEHVVALFILTTIAGSILYRRVQVKK